MTSRTVVTFVSAVLASGLLTWLWIGFARARRIEDQPDRRRLHQTLTPRGGGIAIAVSVVACLLWIAWGGAEAKPLLSMAFGIALFGLVGLLDDVLPVSTLAKFAFQLLAAATLVLTLSMDWPLGWIAKVGLILACAYVVNIWNFMDGSNGLVTVQAVVIAVALAFWPSQADYLQLAAIALAGASLGFLPFNLPNARVFLGDTGSHVLGATVFGLLFLSWHEGSVGWQQSLLIGSVLLLDSGLTLLRRLVARKKVWTAHREHLYQYAVRLGHSHLEVCICYGAVTIGTVILAMVSARLRSSLVMSGLLIFSWAVGTLIYLALRSRWLEHMNRGRGHG